jgi:hypothetical protein
MIKEEENKVGYEIYVGREERNRRERHTDRRKESKRTRMRWKN